MDAEDTNKAIMQKVVDIFSSGDLSEVDSLFAPGYVDHQKPEGLEVDGPEEFKIIVQGTRKSTSDTLIVTIEDLIADENSVVARLRWHGSDASGTKTERETIDILRI